MKDWALMAERKVEMGKIRGIKALEINLQLLYPPETRLYYDPTRAVSSAQGYPQPMPSRKKGYAWENRDAGRSGSMPPQRASVKVNSVLASVTATRI